jgi:RHS repeat-associated protein
MLTGNLESNFNKLEIFIDSIPGGQNRLRGNNPSVDFNGLNRMGDDGSGNGLTFEAVFTADYWIGVTGGDSPYQIYANYAELLTSGGGQGYFLGQTGAASNGTLSGGTNPFGIRATINNSNTAGVTAGSGASSGAGVASGIELAIPLAAIGNPTGTISICAFVNGASHDFVSNQVLAGIGGGANLGEPRSVNFGSITGTQSFTVSNGSPVSNFYYDGWEEIEDQSLANSTAITQVFSKGAFSLVQATVLGFRDFYHEDDLHSVVKVTDSTGALVLQQTEYGDYGKPFNPGGLQSGNLNTIYDSDSDASPAYEIADDFWFAATTNITAVRWWGGYDYASGTPSFDQFVVRIYDSDSTTGLPSNLLRQESFSSSQLARIATGRQVCCASIGAAPEYQYDAPLSSAFTAQANVRYWLAVVNYTSGFPGTWGLETSDTGNARGALRQNAGSWSSILSDSAFQFTISATTTSNPTLYRGYRFDSESGFHWSSDRYLDPRSGRFIQRHPGGMWSATADLGNPFSYAGNNPWTLANLLGLQETPTPAKQEEKQETPTVLKTVVTELGGPPVKILEGGATLVEAVIVTKKAVECTQTGKTGKRCNCEVECRNTSLGGNSFRYTLSGRCCNMTEIGGGDCADVCDAKARELSTGPYKCERVGNSNCVDDSSCPLK